MLGFALCQCLRDSGYQVIEWDLPEHDVSNVTPTIREVIRLKPRTIFHLAAVTDVDACEKHQAEAYRHNTLATWTMAIAARDSGAELVYLSTDYVFDGTKRSPYQENDAPHPVNYYGRTKLLGEQVVIKDVRRRYICRSSWLFGAHGRNFVDTIIRTAAQQPVIEVVDDQQGSPTYTGDLAGALVKLIDSRRYGIYHITNTGSCTWFQLARAVVEIVGLKTEIRPISSKQSGRQAIRPAYSVLDNRLFQLTFGYQLRPWREALVEYLRRR